MIICLSLYKYHEQILWGFDIYYLTFEDKVALVLVLHSMNQLLKTLKAKSSFQTLKKSLSDWFGPKCNCKVSSYLDN